MAGSTLPAEVLANIFGHLSPCRLAIVSRVCHSWQAAAFSPLYQTVYLCLATHLEQFVERVSTDEGGQFSIAAHLRGLVFDIEYYETREEEMIGESDVDKLNAIIPRLTHLRHFSWNLMFVPQDPETFRLFQTQCPKLDSVHIWIKGDIDFYGEQYETLFNFKNLTYFSLSIWDIPPGFNDHQLEPLASILARCPELSSIKLNLDSGDDETQYSPSELVTALGDDFVYPRLRCFHAQGSEDPEWSEFFGDPESHSFRQFLSRHPAIEDLALGYSDETLHYGEIDPAEIAQLFPSLRQFEGPVFIVLPLILSGLTDQIEKLIVVDRLLRDDVSLDKMYDQISALPRLRKFGIWAETITEEGILVNMLRTIVNAAGQLEDIEIHPDIDSSDYETVMGLIKQVRGLRSITLNESVLAIAGESNDQEPGWDAFAMNLRRACPKLRTIYQPIRKFDKENRKKVWESHDYA